MTTWLCIDVSCLCHRAWHALPHLGWKGRATEVIYGFLNSVQLLRQNFSTDNIAFCFDSKSSKRRDLFPDYKRRRGRMLEDPAKALARQELHEQIDDLRLRHLPAAGFSAVFYYPGLESDDILATIAKTVAGKRDQEAILVTSDSDLWQCLRPNVHLYDPQKRKIFTAKIFTQLYGITPSQWLDVKVLAGCKTDEVPGIPGVGEVTALKYVRGELPSDHPIRSKVLKSQYIINRNIKLIKLPWNPCPVPDLKEQRWNPHQWNVMLRSLGIRPR